MFSKRRLSLRSASLCLFVAVTLVGPLATAQGSSAGAGSKPSPSNRNTKQIRFEVVSVHPVRPGWSPYDDVPAPLSNTQPSPVGFSSILTVWQMLMIAYASNSETWQGVPIKGAPTWFQDRAPVWYVIHARVSDQDREAWRNQSNRHELLQSAMQTLLKERCKLALHEQPTELPDYKLLIGKKGLKGLKPTAPDAALPKGVPLPSGGVMIHDADQNRITWHFHGATMSDLVDFITGGPMGRQRRPIHDGTGLTGRYDFTLQRIEESSRDPDQEVYNWPVGPLGLELKPGKYTGSTLVVDHLEKPVTD